MGARIKLLVTRPRPDAERTAAHLTALGIEPIIAPMLHAIAQDGDLPAPDAYGAVALTSANAVRFLLTRASDEALLGKQVFAVGNTTAETAREAGFRDVVAAGGTLLDLAGLIAARHSGGAVFHPAARDLSGDLEGLLRPKGIPVLTATIYAMEQARTFPDGVRAALIAGGIAGALFFSRRTAEAFANLADGPDFAGIKPQLHCLCLSENCAQPLIQSRFLRVALADHPSHEAMMALALAFARDQIRA